MPKSLSDFPVRETLGDTLGMEIVEGSAERVVATMPVEPRHHQPLGYLHGGATVALAAPDGYTAFGQEINANHLRPMREGLLTATGTPIHVGRTSQVWGVEVRGQDGKMVCVSRCTLAVVPLRREPS